MSDPNDYKAPEFGLPVSLQQADKYYAKARAIEDRSQTELENLFADDAEANAYYSSPAYGFIFSKENIQGVLEKMETDDHYLVLFQGAKTSGTIAPEEVGRRTLIAMVYKAVPENENGNGPDNTYSSTPEQTAKSADGAAAATTTTDEATSTCMTLELDQKEFSTPQGRGPGSEHPGIIVMAAKPFIPRLIKRSELKNANTGSSRQ